MLKLIIICASLFTVSSSESLVLQKPTWTKQLEIPNRYSVTVAIGLQLFTVSHNTTHVYVNSTDYKYKTCIFDDDSLTNNPIQVAVLGNERKIVIWSVYNVQFYAETVKVLYTMLLIDLRQCNYNKILLPQDQQSRYLHRMNFDLTGWQPGLQVVTYLDSFDVFFGGSNKCSPCRFDDDGDKIKVQHQLKAPGNESYGAGFIESLDSNSWLRGYFQIYQLVDHSATIKLLDGNFKVLKQVRVEHHISKVFVIYGKNAMIAVCYLAPSSPQPRKLGDIYCKEYDAKLQLQASIEIPVTTKYYPIGFSLTLDIFGNMYVTYETLQNDSTKLALSRYTKGQLFESFDLGQVHTIGREVLLQHPLIINRNREFCFVTAKKFHVNRILKCIMI